MPKPCTILAQALKTKMKPQLSKGCKAFKTWQQKGYIPALMAVGNMFVNGNIVPQNLPEAKKIFASLAQENVPQAKESLAVVKKIDGRSSQSFQQGNCKEKLS